ncbi:MAG TPA: hypothetical protein VI968_04090 [archaeon]|nr:hypothetical protein [archaeon]
MARTITGKNLKRYTALGRDLVRVHKRYGSFDGCLSRDANGCYFVNPVEYSGDSAFLSDKKVPIRDKAELTVNVNSRPIRYFVSL